jgi:DNA-binding NtrC family response regulator
MNERAVVLVVEDDPGQREQLAGFLGSIGVETRVAADAAAARAILGTESVDVVVTDLRLPGESGLELLAAARRANPLVDFIVVTAYGSVGNAVEAMRSGAHDFLEKPVDLDVLELRIRRLLERRGLSREVRELRERLRERIEVEDLVAESEGMQEVLSVVRRVAPTDSTVLLTGESGTGKERIAEVIHGGSRRRDRPFIRVNCAAMPETLLETELFGHVRGAFTGAHQDRVGRFEEANGGTLLLDEIGDLSPATQAKLLRALQEREIVRVGENRARRVDVRIIAATNRDLTEEKRAGRFREDLLYRIEVIAIRIPPLRERRPDTVELIQRLLARFSREVGRGPHRISREAHDLLLAYPWPGNVRELQNVLQRAVILAPGEQIRMEDLPEQVRRPPEPEDRVEPLGERTLPEMVEELERRALARALAAEGGVKARAARRLGLPERVLRYKMAKYGL